MATYLKTPLQTTCLAGDAFTAKPAAPARADVEAVSLEIPIKVYGSRVSDAGPNRAPHTEPFEEQSTTMIVSPRMGVFPMTTPVCAGQMLVLTNLKSDQDTICRVAKVRTFSPSRQYVEAEFTSNMPSFWGVDFSAKNPVEAKKDAAIAVAIVERKAEQLTRSLSQEDLKVSAKTAAVISAPSEPRAIAAAKETGERALANLRLIFEAVLDFSRNTWKPIIAAAAIVMLLGSGLYYQLRIVALTPAELKAVVTPPPSPRFAVAAYSAPLAPAAAAKTPAPLAQPVPNPEFRLPENEGVAALTEAAKPGATAPSEPTTAKAMAVRPQPVGRNVISNLFGALNAHPMASRHAVAASPAPALESMAAASAGNSATVSNGASTGGSLPLSSPFLAGGGVVKEPKLITSVPPAFPAAAKALRNEGDVVVQALVDATGKVVDASIVSGPDMFRRPALEAVRRWKYEPRTVDGTATPAKIEIRVKFRL